MRYFNTTGPCDPSRHYTLSATNRLPQARRLIEEGRYFVVHAPRQTGKTTTMTGLAREITAVGAHAALLFSVEDASPWGEDISAVELSVLAAIWQEANRELPSQLRPPQPWPDAAPGKRLSQGLMDWAVACPLPLALIIDEIDSLQGAALVSVLRQLRSGFRYKGQAFPDSVALCGMRDLKDYRLAAGSGPVPSSPGSPFNISEGSLRIGDFTRNEVAALYAQRTEETGQEFTAEAVGRAYDYSQGQPWLVNALAYEITRRMMIVPPTTVTAEHVDAAKEGLILAGDTHLDSLSARLHEPRIQRFIEPLLACPSATTSHTTTTCATSATSASSHETTRSGSPTRSTGRSSPATSPPPSRPRSPTAPPGSCGPTAAWTSLPCWTLSLASGWKTASS